MISPWQHHIANAIRFKQDIDGGNTLWGVIGGTAAWPDENAPPSPAFDVDAVLTPIGAKQATVIWARPDSNGPLAFLGPNNEVQRWSEVTSVADVDTHEVRWCIVSVEIVGNELPLTTFRVVAFVTNLTHTAGAAAAVVTPAQVTSYGRIEAIEYRRASARQAPTTDVLTALIEF